MINFCFSVVIVFNIHINKLFFISLSPKVSSYADDTQIFSIGHSCPIHSKGVESSLCTDKSSWQFPSREIHEVILTGSWQTLQQAWLQSPEMVILRAWMGDGNVVESSRLDTSWHDMQCIPRSLTSADEWYFLSETPASTNQTTNALNEKHVQTKLIFKLRMQTKQDRNPRTQCILRSINFCGQVTFQQRNACARNEAKDAIKTRSHAMYTSFFKLLQKSNHF